MRGYPRVVLLATVATLAGCAALTYQPSSVSDAEALTKLQNARGCIYLRGNARPYADVTLFLIGTWGLDPPPYAECWQGLPSVAP